MISIHLCLIFVITLTLNQSGQVESGQPLMNQLAAFLRARPAFPTTFPLSTSSASNDDNINNNGITGTGNSGGFIGNIDPKLVSDMISNQITNTLNKNFEDFSHFNDLLTSPTNAQFQFQNLNGQQNFQHINGINGNNINYGNSLHQLVSGSGNGQQQILATSHPLPQLEFDTGNGKTKAILIAHPVLGPNQLPPNLDQGANGNNNGNFPPDTGYNDNSNNGINTNTGLYANKPNAIRTSPNYYPNQNSLQHQMNQKQFNMFKMSQQKYSKYPQVIPISGKPPPGGKVIAIPIPVPSNSPFLSQIGIKTPQFYHQPGNQAPQIIAVRQPPPPMAIGPFPAISITTSSPPIIPSEQISTSKFNPSPPDHNSQTVSTTKLTTTVPITTVNTNATTTTVTTTTLATTTPPPTITTTSPPPPPPTAPPTYTTAQSYPTAESFNYNNYNNFRSDIPSPRPTPRALTFQQPPPTGNNIQEVIQNYQKRPNNFLEPSPSTSTLVGSFRYPDPPTPPNMQSMNTRYELQNEDVIRSTWPTKAPIVYQMHETVPPNSNINSNSYSKSYYTPKRATNPGASNGYFSSSIASIPLAVAPLKTKSKWRFEDSSPLGKATAYSNFKKDTPGFKPSLQLHSFEDSTSGLKEYITINPTTVSYKGRDRDSKSLFQTSTPSANEDLPAMESGFRPFNHFAYINGVPGASISTTTESSVLNLIRNEFMKDTIRNPYSTPWNNPSAPPPSSGLFRQDRKFFNPPRYMTAPHPTSTTTSTTTSTSNMYGEITETVPGSNSWVGKTGTGQSQKSYNQQGNNWRNENIPQATTSSSELYEDWLAPKNKYKNIVPKVKDTWRFKNPLECEKFHRFGFCPVTSHYPLEQVESISQRCATLLTHLIAPLPKTDVRYDVIVPKIGGGKSRSGAPSGWNWKNFAGKPMCDTKEVKIIPGFAKNEHGEWLVILQTQKWKQEAQISLCTSQETHNIQTSTSTIKTTKCVQRFTAQRLVVLDPEDEERCPVVRSVFLPSACVCLNSNDQSHNDKSIKKNSKPHHNHTNGHGHGHHASPQTQTKNAKDSATTNSKNKPTGKPSKVIAGRSLSTSFFGLLGLDLDQNADATNSETEQIQPTSASVETDNDNNDYRSTTLNVPTTNSTFMVVTSSSSSESSETGDTNLYQDNDNGNITRSTSLGSSFMVSGSNNGAEDSQEIDSNG